MLNSDKSKVNFETSPLCGLYQIKETSSHFHLESNKFKKEREELLNNISSILGKHKVAPQNVTIEELLGEISTKVILKLSGEK